MSTYEREIPPGSSPEHPRVVSDLSKEEAIRGNPALEMSEETREIAEATRERQAVVRVTYITFSGEYEQGQLVVDKAIASDVEDLFSELLTKKFPIGGVRPITEYEWNDDASMEQNNSSAHNFRFVGKTTKLSLHSLGIAIDINPKQNPMVIGADVFPAGATYDKAGHTPGTVTPDIVALFARHGFSWGGQWESLKDYQHFQVDPETLRNRALKAVEADPRNETAGSEAAYWQKIINLQKQNLLSH